MDSAEIVAIKAHIWNGWSSNYVRKNDGYIIHMCPEETSGWPERSFCGVRIQETGAMTLNETEPGCIKCRRILRKRGLLPAKMPATQVANSRS